MEKIKANMQNLKSKEERESSLGKLDFIIHAYNKGVYNYLKNDESVPKENAVQFQKKFEMNNMLETIENSSKKGLASNLIDHNYQIIATYYFKNLFKSTMRSVAGSYLCDANEFLSRCSPIVHYSNDAELTELEKSMALLFIKLKLAPLEKQTWEGTQLVLNNYMRILDQIASLRGMASAVAVCQGNANR